MSHLIDNWPGSALHWYDLVCPFCYVGQSRTAILMAAGLGVVALPFQAHPEIPAGGVLLGPRRGPMYPMLEREAEAAGLTLRWPARIPNSRSALAAAEWVRVNAPDAFIEVQHSVFRAHFVLGEDIDNQAVIDRHATNAGVELGALHTALADGSAYAGVDQAETAAGQRGIDGTPAWLLGGRLVVGLRPESEFQRLAEDARSLRAR
jgi:predicted DsbA family dithiol-disulfide isomerase